MGLYLVIETNNGLVLMWDKKTGVAIKLSSKFKVGKQLHMNITKVLTLQVNSVSFYLREKSAVCVGIMTGMLRMISPPEARRLQLTLMTLETVGKCQTPALMQITRTILAKCTPTGRLGH